jgi:hypothetical protein
VTKVKARAVAPVQLFAPPTDFPQGQDDDDLGEADGEMSDGDFALVLIAAALADKRFQTYEAADWNRFLRSIVKQLHVDGDAYEDTERAAAWLDRSVAKRDELAGKAATPAPSNVFLLPQRDNKET